MLEKLRNDAEKIYTGAIKACLPERAVEEALSHFEPPKGRLLLVAIGKAAWKMARCAADILGEHLDEGIVITKYDHSEGDIPRVQIFEAAHPVPDMAGIEATERVLAMTEGLSADDAVLFLISGGGSALFESPRCTLAELQSVTKALLASGASINEINAVRKHLSKVKGGRFAEHVYPARVFGVALSDVLGNSLDTIASGPAAPDKSTVREVEDIIDKYALDIPEHIKNALMCETPKEIKNAEHHIGGSVSELCSAAVNICRTLGYKTELLTDGADCEARVLGARLAALANEKCDTDVPLAFVAGGETVVKLKGRGLGGRNQETALAAAELISGKGNIAVFSVGSDGTDGPTDAAGGYVDSMSSELMRSIGIDPSLALEDNDSYHALKAVGGLIVTGATGTNVNDVAVALVLPNEN